MYSSHIVRTHTHTYTHVHIRMYNTLTYTHVHVHSHLDVHIHSHIRTCKYIMRLYLYMYWLDAGALIQLTVTVLHSKIVLCATLCLIFNYCTCISEDFCVARYCRHGEISGTTLAGLKLDRWILSINQTFRSTPIQGSSSVVICVQGKHFCTCFKGGGDGGGGKVNKGGGGKVKVTIECGIT